MALINLSISLQLTRMDNLPQTSTPDEGVILQMQTLLSELHEACELPSLLKKRLCPLWKEQYGGQEDVSSSVAVRL